MKQQSERASKLYTSTSSLALPTHSQLSPLQAAASKCRDSQRKLTLSNVDGSSSSSARPWSAMRNWPCHVIEGAHDFRVSGRGSALSHTSKSPSHATVEPMHNAYPHVHCAVK